MEKKTLIKLPFPVIISHLEGVGIHFEPGSRVGTATKSITIYISDHPFEIKVGDQIELAA